MGLVKPKRALILPKRQLYTPRRKLPDARFPHIWVPKFIPVRAAVAVDAVGTHQYHAAATSFSYSGLTIGASLSNGGVIFIVSQCFATAGAAGTLTATWNGVSCTNLGQSSASGVNGCVTIFGLTNPASGNNTFAISSTASVAYYVYGISFTGVDQTGGATSFPHFASAVSISTTSLADTITTATGRATVFGVAVGTGSTTSTCQLSGVATQDWIDTSDSGISGNIGAAGHALSSGATAAWTGHNSSSDFASVAGIDILAAAAGTVTEEDNSRVPRRYWSGWTPNANLLKNTAQDFSSSAVETNPHWRPWTLPPQWFINRNLIKHRAQDESSSAVETNPHWIGKTYPPQWVLTWQLRQNTAQDFSSNAAETNIHTVFKTWPVQWTPQPLTRAPANDAPQPVQAETNTFFIPRTLPPQWSLQASLKQNTAQDFSSSAAETNPHWIGKTWPVQWVTLALTRAVATDAPQPAQPETNTFFIPRTYPPQWLLQAALRQNTAQDFSSFGVETNVFFIPRTWPAQWNLQASLLRGTAQDFSTTPPATNPVYARYGAGVGFGSTWAIPGEIPS